MDEGEASADRTRLAYGTARGGSLTFQDGTGARRRVRGGEEFEVDRATAAILVQGDPLNVVAVPPT